ncbi:MAG: dienelactone hydrolase family protein [Xanthomonadales bacterium]|nr:dienelactone hydrolase family protein [Xanthomonadales bacterium]MCC6560305.1 dienelactone hydrolase family protein [Xanthomonadales bacterium]
MINDWIELDAADGHRFRVYRSRPPEAPLGSVVVLPESFGTNRHLRWVAEQISAHGYAAHAPCLFDRVGGDIDLEYGDDNARTCRERAAALGFERAMLDVAATATAAETHGPVGCVGFGWGGTLAWLGATRLALPAVSYYGTHTQAFLDETPQAPLLMHLGQRDALIPPDFHDALRSRHPQVAMHLYPAGHGFNCNERSDFHAESAAMAWRRSFAFLREHLAEAPRFQLHSTLAADCVEVGELPLCRVLLMNDARYPWLILVPRVREAREIIDLSRDDQHRLSDEIALLSGVLQSICEPAKLNVAALGNRVPQLHVHVIARFENDAAWPDPVWGRGAPAAYAEGPLKMLLKTLRAALGS